MTDVTSEQPQDPRAALGDGKHPAGRIQDFVFFRELAEVYLLLDHISMSPNKRLQRAGADVEVEDSRARAFIERICKIAWPPDGGALQRADQAATLILALDTLNGLAAPATGASIAFTTLVVGEDIRAMRHAARQRSWWRRALMALADGKGAAAVHPPPKPSARPGFGDDSPSRASLATWAFPGLTKPAERFSWFNVGVIWGLFAWLAFTLMLSWNVATGNALLGESAALMARGDEIAKQITVAQSPRTNAEAAGKVALGAQVPEPSAPTAAPAPGAKAKAPVIQSCDPSGPLRPGVPGPEGANEPPDSATGLSLCDERDDNIAQTSVAGENLRGWMKGWAWLDRDTGAVAKPLTGPADAATARENEVDRQWAATLLNVLGGAVLPICYGVLGAWAAVVRGISAKIRDNLLTPRDLLLSVVQLGLGAVIGGCIGLFVTPAGAAAQGAPGLLGSVHLSASALCFIAGFGVEGVFIALETLIKRVFNTGDSAKKQEG